MGEDAECTKTKENMECDNVPWYCVECQKDFRYPHQHRREYPNHTIKNAEYENTRLTDRLNRERPDLMHVMYLNRKANEAREARARKRREYALDWHKKKKEDELLKSQQLVEVTSPPPSVQPILPVSNEVNFPTTTATSELKPALAF